MNAAHFHLLSNHIPVIGVPLVGALLVVAVIMRQQILERVALVFLVLIALATVPAYLTGERAEEIVEEYPGVAEERIEDHEEAGKIAFIAVELLGGVALVGLFLSRRNPEVPKILTLSTIGGVLVCFGLLAWTANLGGHIRHPEIGGASPTLGDVQAETEDPEH